jgi:hypothetical protein
MLLRNALERVVLASEQLAVRAVVVHAIDQRASRFYEQFGFRALSSRPRTLMVTLAELRAAGYPWTMISKAPPRPRRAGRRLERPDRRSTRRDRTPVLAAASPRGSRSPASRSRRPRVSSNRRSALARMRQTPASPSAGQRSRRPARSRRSVCPIPAAPVTPPTPGGVAALRNARACRGWRPPCCPWRDIGAGAVSTHCRFDEPRRRASPCSRHDGSGASKALRTPATAAASPRRATSRPGRRARRRASAC